MRISLFGKKQKQQQEVQTLWQAGIKPVEKTEEKPAKLFNVPVSPNALAGNGCIITCQCSKHGDGATTVATNMAALLAIANPERVVLLDLDGYGSVRSRMGLPINDCLTNILDWDEIQSKREITRGMFPHSSGVMVIPGVVHFDDVIKVTPALVFKILTILKEQFDYIVVDCPPVGINNNTWSAALVSDVILTILKPGRTSLDLLNENIGFLRRLGCQDRSLTILNQAGLPKGIQANDLLNTEKSGINVHAVLPYSDAVEEANNKRELIAISSRRNSFSQALQELVEKFNTGEM